ncbi:MAG TPA: hypothetical protein VJ845_01355, partial [Haploplasma sp.]|nr:hypothetical protein [Haploplasma sp.]
ATKVLAELGESNIKYMTPLRTKEAIDYNLIPVNTRIDTIADLSPYHYEGTFIGDDLLQNDFDNLIVDFEDLKDGPAFKETKLQGSYFVCSAESSFWFNTIYHWSVAEGTGKTSTITYTWSAPYDLSGLTDPINMKPGDIISILDFSYDANSNTISTLIKVEKNPEEKFVLKNDDISGATKPKITYDAKGLVTAGADLTAEDIPTLPITKITNLSTTLSDIDSDITALENTVAGIETLLEAI